MTSNSPNNDNSEIARIFIDHENLASELLPYSFNHHSKDGSHDLAHIIRVWINAKNIQTIEGGDLEIITAAVILHDCFTVEKSSPLRSKASTFSSERACDILKELGWTHNRYSMVAHAIQSHSFSANIEPQSLEACILQDADRLDAIGLIGVARCFYTAGRMGTQLYSASDPEANKREYQDKYFALDHFPSKLLKLNQNFRTKQGGKLAKKRHDSLVKFYNEFLDELMN